MPVQQALCPPARGAIREARASELRSCARLVAEVDRSDWKMVWAALVEVSFVQRMLVAAFQEGAAERRKARLRRRYQLLLLEEKGCPAAVCELDLRQSVAQLSSLAVRVDRRHCGLAVALLEDCKTRLLPGQAMQLDVYEDNVPAEKLYEKCGFRPVGYTPVTDLETDALLGRRSARRWAFAVDASVADALEALEAPPTSSELGSEMLRRLLRQVWIGLLLSCPLRLF